MRVLWELSTRDIDSAVVQGASNFATNGGIDGITAGMEQALNLKSQNYAGAASQFALQAIPQLSGKSPNQLLALQTGQVYNPNVELLYQAPNFRTFSFNFDFIPSNAGEADTMNQIIRSFKSNSAP